MNEAVPKSVKERIFRKVRPGKIGPSKMVPKDRVVPRKTGNNVPIMYRHGEKEEEEKEEIKEEIMAEDLEAATTKIYEAMRKGMGEALKLFEQIGQVMKQTELLMQKLEKTNVEQRTQREREQQAERRIERSADRRTGPTPGSARIKPVAPVPASTPAPSTASPAAR